MSEIDDNGVRSNLRSVSLKKQTISASRPAQHENRFCQTSRRAADHQRITPSSTRESVLPNLTSCRRPSAHHAQLDARIGSAKPHVVLRCWHIAMGIFFIWTQNLSWAKFSASGWCPCKCLGSDFSGFFPDYFAKLAEGAVLYMLMSLAAIFLAEEQKFGLCQILLLFWWWHWLMSMQVSWVRFFWLFPTICQNFRGVWSSTWWCPWRVTVRFFSWQDNTCAWTSWVQFFARTFGVGIPPQLHVADQFIYLNGKNLTQDKFWVQMKKIPIAICQQRSTTWGLAEPILALSWAWCADGLLHDVRLRDRKSVV